MQPVDGGADEAEHGRQQGHRQRHHDPDRQGRTEGDAVQVGEPHDDHAEQADHHRRPGEQDRAAGGSDRRHDRLPRVVTVVEGVAVAGDDEQRVVDAHPDGDHRGHRRRPFGHVDHVGEECDQPGGDPDAEDGGDDGQAHREQRPEADQQDHPGGEEADAFGADGALLGVLHCLAGQLDLDPVVAGVRRSVEQPLGDLDGHVPGVELHGGVGDGAVPGDLALSALAVRAGDGDDVVEVGRRGQDVVDLAPHGGRGHVLGSPDDVDGVAGAGGEAVVEQVGGSFGLRSGGPVVGGVATAEAAAGDRRRNEDDEPGGDDETPVPVAEVGQSFQHRVLLGSVRFASETHVVTRDEHEDERCEQASHHRVKHSSFTPGTPAAGEAGTWSARL